MNKEDIIKIISDDEWMMSILRDVKKLNLPDWYIGAGFIRGKIWDTLHGYSKRTPISDIDVIYFDKNDFSKEEEPRDTTRSEIKYEEALRKLKPDENWSVTNQARMHVFHNEKPYISSEEALGKWIETATCIGARIDESNNVIISTPHGIDDLVNLILRPTTTTEENINKFVKRYRGKRWLEKWPKLKVVNESKLVDNSF